QTRLPWGKQTFPPRAPFPSVRRDFARRGSAGPSPAAPRQRQRHELRDQAARACRPPDDLTAALQSRGLSSRVARFGRGDRGRPERREGHVSKTKTATAALLLLVAGGVAAAT